jgi:hypothetical protein
MIGGGPGPWESNQERLVSDSLYANTHENRLIEQALAEYTASNDEIRGIRPPLPQIQMWPDRNQPNRPVIGIEDIARLDDLYQRIDFSGSQSGYQGTGYPALGVS